MQCKVHEFRVSANQVPAIEVSVAGQGYCNTRDWTELVEAKAALKLVCHKCGQCIEFTGYGVTRISVD